MHTRIHPAIAVLALSTLAAAQSGSTTRVSVDSSGAEAFLGGNAPAAVSLDGRFIAFASLSSDLVLGDSNFRADIFVRDTLLGTTERASVGTGGIEGSAHCTLPAISGDGRFVAFQCGDTTLVPGDSNYQNDVFLRDRQAGTTVRVTLGMQGTEPDADCDSPAISSDGRFVAFRSDASNLVTGDTNGASDVFVFDRTTGAIERVSVSSSGTEADAGSGWPTISGDGRFVCFEGGATNLVPGDTNGVSDIFVHDRLLHLTERVSRTAAALQADADCYTAAISGDGRCVSFQSGATNLVPGDTNGLSDVFVKDRQTGALERVSVDSSGNESLVDSYSWSISADGRYVAFHAPDGNLVANDTNGFWDCFVHDRVLGATYCVSVDANGLPGNGDSFMPSPSSDGRFVAFDSSATNLIGSDGNSQTDVFVRERILLQFTSLCDPGSAGVIACPCGNPPSVSGRGCNNSSSTGGAQLGASGNSSVANDTVVFAASGEKPAATSIVLQGSALSTSGVVFGQGVRCASGVMKRLYTKSASGGAISAPGANDPSVTARSAALGDPISAGQSRWYLVYYRDPIVLGGCPAASTFNATQTGRVDWTW